MATGRPQQLWLAAKGGSGRVTGAMAVGLYTHVCLCTSLSVLSLPLLSQVDCHASLTSLPSPLSVCLPAWLADGARVIAVPPA